VQLLKLQLVSVAGEGDADEGIHTTTTWTAAEATLPVDQSMP
jgi:hypothetical protein